MATMSNLTSWKPALTGKTGWYTGTAKTTRYPPRHPGTGQGGSRGCKLTHLGEEALLGEAQITDGGSGDTSPENILFYAKVIGKHHFSNSLAAVALCRAERERQLTECSLTANEGENVLPARVSPYRIH